MTLVARHGALTDIGLHRKTNEDTFVVRPPLYGVCDGMGGAQAGEVASGLAAETLADKIAEGLPALEAAEAANAAVFARSQADSEHSGMGTTLTAFVLEEDAAHFVHIGDSRAYLLRGGELQQVSDDHSLVGEMVRDGRITAAEAAVHPHRSILSRALGTEATASIDEFAVDLEAGDVMLLCSDGLSGPVPADALRAALLKDDPQAAAAKLVKDARKRGGPDNITAVVVRFDEAPEVSEDETTLVLDEAGATTDELPVVAAATGADAVDAAAEDDGDGDAADALAAAAAELAAADAAGSGPAVMPAEAGEAGADEPPAAAAPPRRRSSARRLGVVSAVLVALVAVMSVGAYTLSTSFFIGVDGGRLAVYSGLPGKVGPVNLHAVYRRSVRTYDSLSPAERAVVDAQTRYDKQQVMKLSNTLGMWP